MCIKNLYITRMVPKVNPLKTKRLVVLIPALDHKRLGKLAVKRGMSKADLVRMAYQEKYFSGEQGNA